ncbi:hypothetical protein OH77DRAFT_1521288 [Trametes cingulata]|nr:hypothetical protein OH77DRAFT_1521288 [Trametes cingulata]
MDARPARWTQGRQDGRKAGKMDARPARWTQGRQDGRKAGKMDAEDGRESGLLNVIRAGILTGCQEIDTIRAGLHRLNVQAIVFPTPHEGGQLILCNKGKGWTFDAGQLLAGVNGRIAYIAFLSDVEHGVLSVLSGHRPRHAPPHTFEPVKDVLVAALNDPEVLPRGGRLVFGLRHLCPVSDEWESGKKNPLVTVKESLKGSDVALYNALGELGLKPLLRMLVPDGNRPLLPNRMIDLSYMNGEDFNVADVLERRSCGLEVRFRRNHSRHGGLHEDDIVTKSLLMPKLLQELAMKTRPKLQTSPV